MSARRRTVRAGALSLRVDTRAALVLGVLAVATAVVLVVSLAAGELPLSPVEVLRTLGGHGDGATHFVVTELRLPRAVLAILAGIALGIAGAIFQELAGNALVSPDIIGVSTGASLAAVAVVVFADASGAVAVSLAAFAGALVAGALLYVLAWRDGVSGYRLVLVGIGLATVLQAGISYVLTRGEIFGVAQATIWLVGSLSGRGWEQVWPLAVVLAALVPVAIGLGRQLDVLQLDDDIARALGASVERSRLALIAVAVALTAIAVAAVGPIAFAAFIAPHLARRAGATVTPSGIVPLAAATGALLVVGADLAGRLLVSPAEIPVGIVTAVVAAPYFLYLLQRASRVGVTG